MSSLVKLPSRIGIAIALYYLNYHRQYEVRNHFSKDMPEQTVTKRLTSDGKPFKWDKEADLDNIKKACGKWGFSSSAGTFFLAKKRASFIYVVDEETFPLARKEKARKVKNKA